MLELSPGNADALLELAQLASETHAHDEPSCSTSHIFHHDPGPAALPVPWDVAPEDTRPLRVVALPLTVDPASVGRPSGPAETLACPSWERYSVRRVD